MNPRNAVNDNVEPGDDGEIDLSSLSDEDLVAQMHDDLYDGLAEEIDEGTHILLNRGWSPDRTLNDALVEGMRIVGIDFRDGILFVPEVLLAANAMNDEQFVQRRELRRGYRVQRRPRGACRYQSRQWHRAGAHAHRADALDGDPKRIDVPRRRGTV